VLLDGTACPAVPGRNSGALANDGRGAAPPAAAELRIVHVAEREVEHEAPARLRLLAYEARRCVDVAAGEVLERTRLLDDPGASGRCALDEWQDASIARVGGGGVPRRRPHVGGERYAEVIVESARGRHELLTLPYVV
jgi:hypothetical protein